MSEPHAGAIHFAPYGSTNAACGETVPRSAGWSPDTGEYADARFTTRRGKTTCRECVRRLRARTEVLESTEDMPTVDRARAEAQRLYRFQGMHVGTPSDRERAAFVAGARWLAPTVAALEAEVARLRGEVAERIRRHVADAHWYDSQIVSVKADRDAERARADAAEAVIERVRGEVRDRLVRDLHAVWQQSVSAGGATEHTFEDGLVEAAEIVRAALSDAAPQAVACTCGDPFMHSSTCAAWRCMVTGARDCGCRPTPDATDGREGA